MRYPSPYDQLMATVEMQIITSGYTIQAVMPDRDTVGWTYTVGLHESFGLPELVVTNLDNLDAAHLLEWVVEQLRDGASFDEFIPSQFTAVHVHPAHLDGELMKIWRLHYDDEPSTVEVMQLRLGSEFGCPCCVATQVDLADPTASLDPTPRPDRARRRKRRRRSR